MSDTQTDTHSHEQPAGEGDHRGKHRGAAAGSEERPDAPVRGRHRRPAPDAPGAGRQSAA